MPAAVELSSYTINDRSRLARKSHYISEGVKHAASIDNYIHAHRADHELVAIGKLAIAHCILGAEAWSSLAYRENGHGFKGRQSNENPIEPNHSWIGLLIKTLSAGRDFAGFCEAIASISFVCFNYDRCIERYLFGAASLIYPDTDFNFEDLSGALNIIHPYGYLGDLKPEQGRIGTFGNHQDERFLLTAASNIRTFTEGMESDVKLRVGDAFALATNAVFLGYGFITVNDEFLFNESPFEIQTVLGTTFGVSDERTEFISDKLKHTCMRWKTPHDGWQQRGSPKLRSEGCSDLILRFSHLFEGIGR